MIVNFFSRILIFSLLAVLQISFTGSLPWFLREINFFIIFLVFFLEFDSRNLLGWFLFAGFILDLYYVHPFGFFMIFLPAVFLFVKFLSQNFFTNRSLYSCMGLTFFSIIFYYFAFYGAFNFLGIYSGESFFLIEKKFWLALLFGLTTNLILAALIFLLTGALSDRLKPFFIIRGKNEKI